MGHNFYKVGEFFLVIARGVLIEICIESRYLIGKPTPPPKNRRPPVTRIGVDMPNLDIRKEKAENVGV